MYELKIYRGVMRRDNKEWCKNWWGIDLPVQNWPEHSKISKICILMDCFLPKYIMFELNLKENWLVLSKITWRIWQIFVHRLKNSDFILETKIGELNQNKNSKRTDRPDKV